MATLMQRLSAPAIRKKDNARTRILEKNPQARGWVNRVTIVTPRKPNSAKRPVVKVFMVKINRLTAHIPGIGHTLKKFSKILVRGRGPRDLPGVRYSGVRGVLDFIGLKQKKRRRSIYGAEQNDMSKVKARRKYRLAIRRAENERIRKENEDIAVASEQESNKIIYGYTKHYNILNLLRTESDHNFFFFKNSLMFFKLKRFKKIIDVNISMLEYARYVSKTSFFNLFSYFYIFVFFEKFAVYNKSTAVPFLTYPNIFYNNKKIKFDSAVHLPYLKYQRYTLFIFFDTYKFFYLNKQKYMKQSKLFFLPPKKHMRFISQKKVQADFFVNNPIVHEKFFVKRISSKINYDEDDVLIESGSPKFSVIYFKNRRYLFRNFSNTLKNMYINDNFKKIRYKTYSKFTKFDSIFLKNYKINFKNLNKSATKFYKNKKLRSL